MIKRPLDGKAARHSGFFFFFLFFNFFFVFSHLFYVVFHFVPRLSIINLVMVPILDTYYMKDGERELQNTDMLSIFVFCFSPPNSFQGAEKRNNIIVMSVATR